MFAEMVLQLKSGIMPDTALLRKRFDRALVKKLGVVRTPPSFWTSDKKINPDSKELLWATILLEDRENYLLVEGIIDTETEEKRKASGYSQAPLSGPAIIESFISELLQLAPSDRFRQILRKKTENIKGQMS